MQKLWYQAQAMLKQTFSQWAQDNERGKGNNKPIHGSPCTQTEAPLWGSSTMVLFKITTAVSTPGCWFDYPGSPGLAAGTPVHGVVLSIYN